jgi:outer membrane lipoprotein-sorting protein
MFVRKSRVGRACLQAAFGMAGCAFGLAGNTATAMSSAEVSPRIQDYVANRLDDFSATMHVVQFDERAGSKINRDFGYIYKLNGDVAVRYKEENRLRLDGRIETARVIFIVNGTKQYVKSPTAGISTTMDLGGSPGKRKTLLDVGLISNGYLAYTQAQFLGSKPVGGVMCALFSISYKDKTLDTSHRLVWIDPQTKVTLKREEYSQTGTLNATFYYKQPTEVAPGIWFPSRIQVLNNQGQKAGETAYKNVRVNAGLDDSLFRQ